MPIYYLLLFDSICDHIMCVCIFMSEWKIYQNKMSWPYENSSDWESKNWLKMMNLQYCQCEHQEEKIKEQQCELLNIAENLKSFKITENNSRTIIAVAIPPTCTAQNYLPHNGKILSKWRLHCHYWLIIIWDTFLECTCENYFCQILFCRQIDRLWWWSCSKQNDRQKVCTIRQQVFNLMMI